MAMEYPLGWQRTCSWNYRARICSTRSGASRAENTPRGWDRWCRRHRRFHSHSYWTAPPYCHWSSRSAIRCTSFRSRGFSGWCTPSSCAGACPAWSAASCVCDAAGRSGGPHRSWVPGAQAWATGCHRRRMSVCPAHSGSWPGCSPPSYKLFPGWWEFRSHRTFRCGQPIHTSLWWSSVRKIKKGEILINIVLLWFFFFN